MGEGTTGMANVVGQLSTGLTADTLWASPIVEPLSLVYLIC